jgi:hypothetical protein
VKSNASFDSALKLLYCYQGSFHLCKINNSLQRNTTVQRERRHGIFVRPFDFAVNGDKIILTKSKAWNVKWVQCYRSDVLISPHLRGWTCHLWWVLSSKCKTELLFAPCIRMCIDCCPRNVGGLTVVAFFKSPSLHPFECWVWDFRLALNGILSI